MARKVPLSQSRQMGRALLQAALHSASEKEIERWRSEGGNPPAGLRLRAGPEPGTCEHFAAPAQTIYRKGR